jgi:hypothetical protein
MGELLLRLLTLKPRPLGAQGSLWDWSDPDPSDPDRHALLAEEPMLSPVRQAGMKKPFLKGRPEMICSFCTTLNCCLTTVAGWRNLSARSASSR